MARREEKLEKALAHYRNYLRKRGFTLSASARRSLREYVMEAKRKENILTALSMEEKTSEDLIEGLNKLAGLSTESAQSEGRTEVTEDDVQTAINQIFCKGWPFCKIE